MAFNWKKQTMKHEGFRGKPYDDAGSKAIGYGSRLSSHPNIDPAIISGARDMTPEEAEALFSPDYAVAMEHAKEYVGEKWAKLTGNQKGVITDMAYNMMKGPTPEENGLFKFEKMRELIQTGDMKSVPAEMMRGTGKNKLSKWAAAVKTRAVTDSTMFNAPD